MEQLASVRGIFEAHPRQYVEEVDTETVEAQSRHADLA